jgi:DNA-binding SARP family transcriptional activator
MFDSAAVRLSEQVCYRPRHSRPASAPRRPQGQVVVPLPGRGVSAVLSQTPARQTSAQHESHHPIELRLLGGFQLLVGGELVHIGRTGQRLLAVVACRGRQATRSHVAHTLWPDTTSARAHANLRTALYRLTRACPLVLHATSSHVQLTVGMQIDLERTTRVANRILADELGADTTADQELLGEALKVNLYDDLLPDWDEEWLGDHQYRYRQLRLTALETLSHHLAAAGNHGAAVQTALAAVQADSLRDSAHEILIRACLAQGNRHEAFLHYKAYRRMLRDELGLDPPANLSQLLFSA